MGREGRFGRKGSLAGRCFWTQCIAEVKKFKKKGKAAGIGGGAACSVCWGLPRGPPVPCAAGMCDAGASTFCQSCVAFQQEWE